MIKNLEIWPRRKNEVLPGFQASYEEEKIYNRFDADMINLSLLLNTDAEIIDDEESFIQTDISLNSILGFANACILKAHKSKCIDLGKNASLFEKSVNDIIPYQMSAIYRIIRKSGKGSQTILLPQNVKVGGLNAVQFAFGGFWFVVNCSKKRNDYILEGAPVTEKRLSENQSIKGIVFETLFIEETKSNVSKSRLICN